MTELMVKHPGPVHKDLWLTSKDKNQALNSKISQTIFHSSPRTIQYH